MASTEVADEDTDVNMPEKPLELVKFVLMDSWMGKNTKSQIIPVLQVIELLETNSGDSSVPMSAPPSSISTNGQAKKTKYVYVQYLAHRKHLYFLCVCVRLTLSDGSYKHSAIPSAQVIALINSKSLIAGSIISLDSFDRTKDANGDSAMMLKKVIICRTVVYTHPWVFFYFIGDGYINESRYDIGRRTHASR